MSIAGTDPILSALIEGKIIEKLSPVTGQPIAKSAYLKAFCDAIAEAVVQHLLSKGECQSGIPVATTGGPTAQVGATTAPGKFI